MKEKQYLLQIDYYDKRITNKISELAQWRALASSTGSQTDGERVQTSPKDRLSTVVSKIVDLDREIDSLIDEYAEKKQEIIRTIESIKNPNYYDLLFKVYIEHKFLHEAAAEMHYSYTRIRHMHKEALSAVDVIINSTQ